MISVIIPAYNVESFIEECLQSVLSQDYNDIEVIVINDGSTDATALRIVEKVGNDPRVTVITQTNGGPSRARNSAIDVAKGEWLFFLDGDDALLPGALCALINLAQSEQADIACGGFVTSTPVGMPRTVKTCRLEYSKAIEFTLYQKKGFYNSAWGKLYRRSLFDGIRFRNGILYEDLDIFYLLYERAKIIACTERPVYFYRTNNQSLLHTFTLSRLDVLDVTARIVDWASSQERQLLMAASDRRLSAAFNMLGLLAVNGLEENNRADECFEIIRQYRIASLFNPKVRLKNKTGILVSFFGKRFLKNLLRLHYKKTRI